MSSWAPTIAIAAVFVLLLVLGLRFLSLYSTKAQHRGTAGRAELESETGELEALQTQFHSIRERAENEAEALRTSVAAEAEALRRAVRTEVEAARASAEAARVEAETSRRRAEAQASDLILDARRDADRELTVRTADIERERIELERRGAELDRREKDLDRSLQQLVERQNEIATAEHELAQRQTGIEQLRSELDRDRQAFATERVAALEHAAALSAEDAKVELLNAVEATTRRDAAALVRNIEAEARAEGTERARAIVVDAVQRVASEQTSETVVSVLHLPSDEMKGRIIGREGRNIRAFESVTGVNVIIDDTPEAVLLSCFDPVRREVGRIALEKLVLDGRIHPHRIEEVYGIARAEVDELCMRAARDAVAEVGITDLDEHLIPTLGRLKYRTSYGQNVLGHLIETAHIAGVMAAELGIEPAPIKRSAFLHDIGKALTHEVEGSHAIIGAELLRKYGESEAVAHAVEAHHNEVQPRTVAAVLTQAADSCSAARPGARRESLETYVKRLERIEQIAASKPGVEKVFAMQSGREVRVMVQPNEIDDLAAGVIAREVAKQIEDELTYPGQIRVTVVRELRATEVAH
jgi:ribonuclease Y